ncbi:hypothetical protein RMATCC62417_15271 [Rhizopus microsporus]|nr:hypothetical protein RMATCC62417_15271 [Rhizopus microsporus]
MCALLPITCNLSSGHGHNQSISDIQAISIEDNGTSRACDVESVLFSAVTRFLFEHYQATPTTSGNNSSSSSTSNSSNSSQSSVTSSIASTPTTLYSQIPPQMRPIDILALAAEYVQNCDEEKRLAEERRKSWRPWDS